MDKESQFKYEKECVVARICPNCGGNLRCVAMSLVLKHPKGQDPVRCKDCDWRNYL